MKNVQLTRWDFPKCQHYALSMISDNPDVLLLFHPVHHSSAAIRNPASEQSWGFCWCCRRQNRSVWASTAMLTRRCWQKYKYDFAKILTATWIKYMQQQAGILTRKNGHAPHFCRWWQVLVPGEISSQPGVLKKNVIQLHPNIFRQIRSVLSNKRGIHGFMQSQEGVRTNPRTEETWLSVFLSLKTIEFLTLHSHKDRIHSLPVGVCCVGPAQIIQDSLTAAEKCGNSTFQSSFCSRGPELNKLGRELGGENHLLQPRE